MQKLKYALLLIPGIIFFASSCSKKSGAAGPAGPAGPHYTGAISGHVTLYDQYGSIVNSNLAGIQLTLNNPATTVSTDANGYYIFTGVTTGSYNISATNPNTIPFTYGNNFTGNFQFLSDTLNKDIKLSARPTFYPTVFSGHGPLSSGIDSLSITFNHTDTRIRSYIVFVNNNASVSSQPANYLIAYVKNIPANAAATVSLLIPAQDLHDAGISSGATAYYAVYSCPVNNYSSYEDVASGKTVYNALDTISQVTSAIAP